MSVSTSCHYSHSPKWHGYCRNRNYYDRQYTFQKNITVIVNNRIQSCQRLREIIRHIIHPIKISAKCMECPSLPELLVWYALRRPCFLDFVNNPGKAPWLQIPECNHSIPEKMKGHMAPGGTEKSHIQDR